MGAKFGEKEISRSSRNCSWKWDGGSYAAESRCRRKLSEVRQKARRDEMRLRLWAKLVRMSETRIAKKVYRESRARMEREEREGKLDKTDTWCLYTRDLLKELGLEEAWNEDRVTDEWNTRPDWRMVD